MRCRAHRLWWIRNTSDVPFRYRINYVSHGAGSSTSKEFVVQGKKTRKVTVHEGIPHKLTDPLRCEVFSAMKIPASALHPKLWYRERPGTAKEGSRRPRGDGWSPLSGVRRPAPAAPHAP